MLAARNTLRTVDDLNAAVGAAGITPKAMCQFLLFVK